MWERLRMPAALEQFKLCAYAVGAAYEYRLRAHLILEVKESAEAASLLLSESPHFPLPFLPENNAQFPLLLLFLPALSLTVSVLFFSSSAKDLLRSYPDK